MSASERLDLAAARFLVSESGSDWARRVAEWQDDDSRVLRRLRADLSPDRAAALVSQRRGRASLAARHPHATRLHTTAVAAQQASSWPVATWRAARFAGADRVADLCCGVGLDSLALTAAARVVSVDSDHPRMVLAAANLAHLAPGRSRLIVGRVPEVVPAVDLVFCDPDRRVDGRRVVDPEAGSPPLSELLRATRAAGLGVKLSPMVALDRLSAHGELEFISAGGELKEIVLWCGDLATTGRRASRPDRGGFSVCADDVGEEAPVRPLGAFLLDPDPALVRSGLLAHVALSIGAHRIDPGTAYLSSPAPIAHPLLRVHEVLATLPANPRRVTRFLVERGIGRVDVSRRGFPDTVAAWERRLRPRGDAHAHLHLTRVAERPIVVVTRPCALPAVDASP